MELSQALITGQNVSLNEALSQGLMVTGVGLSIVFAVLVILMIVLYLFKVIFYKAPSKTVKREEKVENLVAVETAVDETDEEELIAVLTAAIAASLNTSTYNLKIKSYRRIDNNISAWNKAGVTETINNRF